MIHTVTTFEKITKIEKDNQGKLLLLPYPEFGDIHCAGYYESVEDALLYMDKYAEKLHDGNKEYCIIEEYNEGLFNPTTNRYLFKWNKDRYEQIDEPITINSVTNFAMG